MLASKICSQPGTVVYLFICWLVNSTQCKCRKFQSFKLKMPVAGVDCVESAIQVEQLNSTLKGLSLVRRLNTQLLNSFCSSPTWSSYCGRFMKDQGIVLFFSSLLVSCKQRHLAFRDKASHDSMKNYMGTFEVETLGNHQQMPSVSSQY